MARLTNFVGLVVLCAALTQFVGGGTRVSVEQANQVFGSGGCGAQSFDYTNDACAGGCPATRVNPVGTGDLTKRTGIECSGGCGQNSDSHGINCG